MDKLKEHLLILPHEHGYSIYGLPHAYVENCYPEIDWTYKTPVIVTEEDAFRIMKELADSFGYELTRITLIG